MEAISHVSKISITQLTSLLSLLLAIIALSFSVWQYFDKKAVENSLRKSRIIMRIGAIRDGNIIFDEIKISSKIIFRQKYRCVLSNIGYVDEGIVDCKIYSLEHHELNGENKLQYAWYAGMNPEFRDENNREISFPLNISARESQTIYINIGMIVPRLAWESVADLIVLGQSINWKDADAIFNDLDYPCFGQLSYVETENVEDFAMVKLGQGVSYQTFWIQFFKTDNVQVTGEFSLMGSDMHIQGET